MSPTSKKIQKLRTFRGDMEAVRAPTLATAPEPMAPKVSEPAVINQLPPVLNAKKAEVTLPPLPKPTTPAPIPAPDPVKPASSSTIQSDITSMLGGAPKPATAPEATPVIPPLASKPLIVPTAAVRVATSMNEPVAVMETSHHDDLGGTVITNQKHGRFKLLPSIWEAIKLWVGETEKTLARRAEKRRQAIPTVRTLEERQATVKKAATAVALSPKDDYAKLARKLPPQRPVSESAPVIKIAKKEAAPAPSWGHYEGQVVKPEIETAKLPPVVEPAPMTVAPVTPAPVIPPPVPPTPPARPKVEAVQINVGQPQPTPRPIVPEPAPIPPPKITETAPTPVRTRQTTPTYAAPRRPRNFKGLFYVGVAATAIVAMVGGVVLVNLLFGGNTNTPVAPVDLPTAVVTPIREDNIAKVILGRDRANWYTNISAQAGSSVITIAPVINIGGAESPASVDQILSAMSWRLEPAFLRSIKDITFIMVADKPAIVLEVASFDSAFGGLLISEKALSGELAPLFGAPVTATYKLGVGTVAPEFVDELADNHDVRVLKDETETERLVYGFTDQNTLIITPDKETFTQIVERLR